MIKKKLFKRLFKEFQEIYKIVVTVASRLCFSVKPNTDEVPSKPYEKTEPLRERITEEGLVEVDPKKIYILVGLPVDRTLSILLNKLRQSHFLQISNELVFKQFGWYRNTALRRIYAKLLARRKSSRSRSYRANAQDPNRLSAG